MQTDKEIRLYNYEFCKKLLEYTKLFKQTKHKYLFINGCHIFSQCDSNIETDFISNLRLIDLDSKFINNQIVCFELNSLYEFLKPLNKSYVNKVIYLPSYPSYVKPLMITNKDNCSLISLDIDKIQSSYLNQYLLNATPNFNITSTGYYILDSDKYNLIYDETLSVYDTNNIIQSTVPIDYNIGNNRISLSPKMFPKESSDCNTRITIYKENNDSIPTAFVKLSWNLSDMKILYGFFRTILI